MWNSKYVFSVFLGIILFTLRIPSLAGGADDACKDKLGTLVFGGNVALPPSIEGKREGRV